MIRWRMKIKFDFSRALVFVSLLSSDPDRGRPGLHGVEEICARRRQMPVLKSKLMQASRKHAGCHRVFHLNDSEPSAEIRRLREVHCRELQLEVSLVQPDD